MTKRIEFADLPSVFPDVPVISIAGAGGKTTLMFRLADTLPGPCAVTTTTKVGEDQSRQADVRLALSGFPPRELRKVMWVSPTLEPVNGKIHGCAAEEFTYLSESCSRIRVTLINEADGAECRHIKAPAAHEPVIPLETTVCFYLVGLDVLGKPISFEYVHRPENFEKITKKESGKIIDTADICRLMDHPDGGLKGMPKGALRIAYLTHADTPDRIRASEIIADRLKWYDYICINR